MDVSTDELWRWGMGDFIALGCFSFLFLFFSKNENVLLACVMKNIQKDKKKACLLCV